eukprot:NODE_64_length_24072_cov_0.332541.p3 type:complete len:1056 gc:universal NODE_64_length_24072_cov_0.332541:10187-13354(+)
MDLFHRESVLLLDGIMNESQLNLAYFATLFKLEWNPLLRDTLMSLKGILGKEFTAMEVVKKSQKMTVYTLYKVLQVIGEQHNHRLPNTISAHDESLISHLVSAMLISTNDALYDEYSNPMLVALCALFHDVGKLGTIQSVGHPKHQMTAFYFHAEMGCGIMSLCYVDNEWITQNEWKSMCLAINYHMCTYHSCKDGLMQLHQRAVVEILSTQARQLLYHLSIGDMFGRFPAQDLIMWKSTRSSLLSDHSVESAEYFSKHSNKGILIQVMGMSGSGKSTISTFIKQNLIGMDISDDDIVYIQRDYYLCQVAAGVGQLEISDNPSREEYHKLHEIYKSNKLADVVNKRMKNDIQVALMQNKIVILDTVAILFQAAQYILPDIAAIAFKINVYVIRNSLLTTSDGDRLGLPLSEQINIHGEKSLLFWMPSDFKKRYSQGLFRQRQMVGNFYNDAGMAKALMNKDSPMLSFVIKWGFESNLEPMFKVIKQLINNQSANGSLYGFDIDLVELVNRLYSKFNFKFIIEFFQGLNIMASQPLKDTEYGEKVIVIKYKENCRFWKAKWARQARGAVLILHGNRWYCIKSLLQRGAEVLTGIHQVHGVSDSQDYHIGKYDHLDSNQQDTIVKFMNKQPIQGILSCKIDGSLLGVTIIPKSHFLFDTAAAVIRRANIPSHLRILKYAISNCSFIPIFSSQGTVVFGTFMEDWYFSAFLVGVCNFQPQYLKSLFLQDKTIEEVVDMHSKDICNELQAFLDLNASLTKNKISCLSFESCCPNRQSEWGDVHTELALSYKTYICKFLGCSFDLGETTGNFVPHINIKLPSSWKQPTVWDIQHTDQVSNMVLDVEQVIYDKMSIKQFYIKYPPKHQSDDFLDFEGFVFYKLLDKTVDYAKIKTLVYYHAHNPNKRTIDGLLHISDEMASHIPSVVLVKSYFSTLHPSLTRVRNDLYTEVTDKYSLYIVEMNSKAQSSYLGQPVDTKIKMIIQNSPSFLSKIKQTFSAHFEHMEHVNPLFFKRLVMKMAIWEPDLLSLNELISTKNQILFDLFIEILDSQQYSKETNDQQ